MQLIPVRAIHNPHGKVRSVCCQCQGEAEYHRPVAPPCEFHCELLHLRLRAGSLGCWFLWPSRSCAHVGSIAHAKPRPGDIGFWRRRHCPAFLRNGNFRLFALVPVFLFLFLFLLLLCYSLFCSLHSTYMYMHLQSRFYIKCNVHFQHKAAGFCVRARTANFTGLGS
jgi:hypothetical protein